MYLKSLTLKGFKSFADRTVMAFDPGLTVVVGPNGSGKSNVSDAILWVLGEQSAKMLRGQAMEDVIFSGSTTRKAVGVAEVTLVLDNSDRTLPVDFEEVAVTRRMYRSGESEYLINAAPARLRDIQDILHDSGLGKDTHSIISQGKLDGVLSSRPEERRQLIEEAADIAKHRRRLRRSERRLESMDRNLVRARDIARELRRQLRPLEQQVERARQAEEVRARLSEAETLLAVDDLRALQASWDALEARDTEAQAAIELARYRLGERQRDLERLQSLLEQKGLFVGDLDAQRRRCQQALGRIESDMRLLEEKGRNMVARISETRRTVSSAEHRRAEAASELERVAGDLLDAGVASEHLAAQVADLEPAAARAREALAAAEARHGELSSGLREALKASDAATLAAARIREAISKAEVEDGLLESRLRQLDGDAQAAREALAAAEGRLAELGEALAAAREREARATEAVGRGEAGLEAARSADDAARLALSEAEARLAALRAVERAAEGASPLAASLAEGAGCAVRCRLADLVSAPPELEGVVEALLGDDLMALVAPDADALADLAEAAVSSREDGAATLVRIDAAPARGDAPADRLLDELDVDPSARGLFELLLGDVALADDARSAIAAAAARPGTSCVSRDGVVCLPDGRVRVGAQAAGAAGSLERRRELRALERGMEGLRGARDAAEADLAAARDALSAAREEHGAASAEAARLEGERTSAASERDRISAQLERADAERARVARQREQAAAELERRRPDLDRLEREAGEASARAAGLSRDVEEAAALRGEAAASERDAASALSEARLSLATVTERSRSLSQRRDQLASQLADFDARIEAASASAASLDGLVARVEPLHARYEAVREAALAWASRLRDRASLASADSESLRATIADARSQVSDAQSALDAANEAAGAVKVERGRLEVEVERAVRRIREDAAMELEAALAMPAVADRAALEADVASLRAELEGIGPVNQVAMEQYSELKGRSDEVAAQVADLEAARRALSKIMRAIARKMRNRFLTVFDQVNENFRDIFSVLFPGGSAHLELTDPLDPANSGVEVVAQPRGKRIQKMSLMSGGERSLTALALLFAVYRTRTVPFYVFDEVEAALDDANLDRLLNAIDRLKGTTQLIVISHQRRTMEKADVLYGVSMQADGVSKAISQRLDTHDGREGDA